MEENKQMSHTLNMGVSKNRGFSPKLDGEKSWKTLENPIKMG